MKLINNFKNQERSFTLIELLIVIAVIGLLAGIVLVATAGVRERAQLARTASWAATNHRMLGADVVLSLDFEECRGVTGSTNFFRDASGFNNNGTCDLAAGRCPLCADGVPGVTGRAVSFDGVNDFVNVLNHPSLNVREITIQAWIYQHNLSGFRVIISKFAPQWELNIQEGRPRIELILPDGGLRAETTTSVITINKWHHVACTHRSLNGEIRCYVDGKRRSIVYIDPQRSGEIIRTTHPVEIGHRSGGLLFHGLIDDVRIYSAAMPLAYIQEQYLQGLQSLLANNGITEQEYNQRMAEFNKNLVSK